MTDEMVEPGPVREMDDYEQEVAEQVYSSIMDYNRHDQRGMQSAEYRVGISELGFCSERTRRMLAQEDPDDTDVLAAFIGTAIGDHAEQALLRRYPHLLRQPDVTVTLKGERNTYHVPGHPDIVNPDGEVIDVKTTRGLEVPRRRGPSQQQQFQRHGYALGAYETNLFTCDIKDVRVTNVWIDRAADDQQVHVHSELFDYGVIEQMTWWLDEVVYAYLNEQTARKEPPYEMCQKVCGFFSTCRLGETDVEGLLTADEVLIAVDMYKEGLALEAAGKRLKDQAKPVLKDVSGSTGEFTVRWVHVNGSTYTVDRKPYDKIDIRKVK
jgi:hypothetical protein